MYTSSEDLFEWDIETMEEGGDEIYFPSYDNENINGENADIRSTEDEESCQGTSLFPSIIERSEDDIAARIQPSRHVDYLSHEWNEEDIWSSWKHLVSMKKAYPNRERLLNASWRTWEKKRRNLKTVSPQTVKWLKDHDVTWLYGPLQLGDCALDRTPERHNSYPSPTSQSDYLHRKPILKKRTISELMLRNSLSSASLLKEAVANTEASKNRDLTASHDSYMFSASSITRRNTTSPTSSAASRNNLLNSEHSSWSSKNVRFHELVEQCIALSHLGDDEPDYHYISDSDSDVVVMRRPLKQKSITSRWLPTTKQKKGSVSKTIEKLPDATLKSPIEVEEQNLPPTPGLGLGRSLETSQQETKLLSDISLTTLDLNSSQSSEEDDSSHDDEEEDDWSPPAWLHNRKDSVQIHHDKLAMYKSATYSPTGEEHLSRDSSFLHQPILDQTSDRSTFVHMMEQPTLEGRDPAITFELPPCRARFDAFEFDYTTSYDRSTTFHTNNDDDDEIDPWSTHPHASTSSTSDYFRPSFTFNNKTNSINPDTKPPTFPIDDYLSPRTSSDSGYGSEDAWKVRDESQIRSREETEKGVRDWERYDGVWDEDEEDEVLAWERGF